MTFFSDIYDIIRNEKLYFYAAQTLDTSKLGWVVTLVIMFLQKIQHGGSSIASST